MLLRKCFEAVPCKNKQVKENILMVIRMHGASALLLKTK